MVKETYRAILTTTEESIAGIKVCRKKQVEGNYPTLERHMFLIQNKKELKETNWVSNWTSPGIYYQITYLLTYVSIYKY